MQLLSTEWNSFLSDALSYLPAVPALVDLPRAAWVGFALLLAVWLGDRLQRAGAARTTGYWLCGAVFGVALVGVQMWLVPHTAAVGASNVAGAQAPLATATSIAQGLPSTWATLQSLAWIFDLALGWVLVELGQRMDLRWLLRNRALAATAVLEYALTWGLAAFMLTSLGLAWLPAGVAATLAAHSSPVLLSTLLAQWRSEGQVTERALHLGSINTVLTAVTLPAVLALGAASQAPGTVLGLATEGIVNASSLRSVLELAQPIWEVLASVAIGFGLGALLSRLRSAPGIRGQVLREERNGLTANAGLAGGTPLHSPNGDRAQWLSLLGAVCVAVGLAQWWGAPALVACLALGLSLRRRAAHALLADMPGSSAGLGQLAQVLMFLVAGACLPWWQWAGLQSDTAGVSGSALSIQVVSLAALLLLVRLCTKTLVCTLTARWAGLRWVQGLALGVMLQPLSMTGLVFTAMAASALASTYPPLAHALLLMLCASDLLAPWLMRSVLRAMREVAAAPQTITLHANYSGLHTQSSLVPRRVDTHVDIQAVG